jgi:hypothetical protein
VSANRIVPANRAATALSINYPWFVRLTTTRGHPRPSHPDILP